LSGIIARIPNRPHYYRAELIARFETSGFPPFDTKSFLDRWYIVDYTSGFPQPATAPQDSLLYKGTGHRDIKVKALSSYKHDENGRPYAETNFEHTLANGDVVSSEMIDFLGWDNKFWRTKMQHERTSDVDGENYKPDFSDLFVRLVFMRLSRPPPVKVL
jgi:hypothetical protein